MNTKKYLSAILFIALLITTAIFFSLPAVSAEPTEDEIVECFLLNAYVIDSDPNGTNVRSGPGKNNPVIATLNYHEEIRIRVSVGEWMLVEKEDEYDPIGWVYGPLLAVVAEIPDDTETTILGC